MIYFSKSTCGFYDSKINKDIPADAVKITAAQYKKLLKDQAGGKIIGAGTNGKPTAKVKVLSAQHLRQSKLAIKHAAAAKRLAWLEVKKDPGLDAEDIAEINKKLTT